MTIVDDYQSDVTEADYYSIGRIDLHAVEQQKTEGWKARVDSRPYHIPDPIDWTVNPFDDHNWFAQFHGWRHMDPHLTAHRLTGDADYLRYIVPWAVSWAEYRRSAPEEKHRTLDALSGMRATRLALVLDACFKRDLTLSDDEFTVLLELARRSAAHLMTPKGIQRMNHGYFQIMGLELLARALSTEDWAPAAVARASKALDELVRSQFTDEGVHVENSPVYHSYALDQLRRSGAMDRMISDDLVEILALAERIRPWYTFPDGGIADIGDSAGPGQAFEHVQDEDTVQVADRHYAVAPFWRSGYAIVRSLPEVPAEQASMLLLIAAAHSHTHSHADKLSFELYECGQRVIVDSGKYGYVRDPIREYVESAVAHNTVGLGDRPIKRTEVLLDGARAFEPVVAGDAIVLTGEVVWERGDLQFTHRRQLTYRPGESLVVRDALASEADRRYVSRLHFDRSLEVQQDDSGLSVDLGEGRTMHVTCADGPITVHRGETDPHRGWQSIDYLKVAPTTMAEVICAGRQRQIEWKITFDGAQES